MDEADYMPISGATKLWTLKIWGKLVDGEGIEGLQKPGVKQAGERPMTSYVRRLRVVLEGEIPTNSAKEIVWEKDKHGAEHCDLFSVRWLMQPI